MAWRYAAPQTTTSLVSWKMEVELGTGAGGSMGFAGPGCGRISSMATQLWTPSALVGFGLKTASQESEPVAGTPDFIHPPSVFIGRCAWVRGIGNQTTLGGPPQKNRTGSITHFFGIKFSGGQVFRFGLGASMELGEATCRFSFCS